MDYEQFKVYMKESVETVTGRKVTVHPLLHNNSLVRDSLSIDTPLGAPAGPAPVLWDYYQQYEKGASPGMLVNDVIRACEDRNRQLQVNPDLLQDFSAEEPDLCTAGQQGSKRGTADTGAPQRFSGSGDHLLCAVFGSIDGDAEHAGGEYTSAYVGRDGGSSL